eukprot:5433652-Heterocapsa_arctica.AAC.1
MPGHMGAHRRQNARIARNGFRTPNKIKTRGQAGPPAPRPRPSRARGLPAGVATPHALAELRALGVHEPHPMRRHGPLAGVA